MHRLAAVRSWRLIIQAMFSAATLAAEECFPNCLLQKVFGSSCTVMSPYCSVLFVANASKFCENCSGATSTYARFSVVSWAILLLRHTAHPDSSLLEF